MLRGHDKFFSLEVKVIFMPNKIILLVIIIVYFYINYFQLISSNKLTLLGRSTRLLGKYKKNKIKLGLG